MATKAATQIATEITNLKRDLGRTGQDLPTRWKNLKISIDQGKKLKELWIVALTETVLQDLVDAAVLTFAKDGSGASTIPLAGAFEGIWEALYPIPNQPATTDAKRIDAFAKGTVRMAESWWMTYQTSISSWRKEGLEVYEAKSRAISTALGSIAKPSLKNLPTKSVQELVLTEMMLGSDRLDDQSLKSFNRLILLCFVAFGEPKMRHIPSVVEDRSMFARRFNQAVEPVRTPLERLRLAYNCLSIFVHNPELAVILRADDQLCISVAAGMWRWYEECGIMPVPERNKNFSAIAMTTAQLFPGPPDQMKRRFTAVWIEHDFISVIIKLLYAFGHLGGPLDKIVGDGDNIIWKQFDDLKGYIISNPVFKAPLKEALKDKLLPALDMTRCNRGTLADSANKYLEELAAFAGLKEEDLRKEIIEERKKAQGGIVGCSWYRCVLYRQATDQVMHWCSGCRTVVYCGVYCQTRDWDEVHKDKCKRRA